MDGPTADPDVFIRFWGNVQEKISMGKTFKVPLSYVLRKGFTVKGLGRQALLLPSSGQCAHRAIT